MRGWLTFTTDGLIEKIVPTHQGAALARGRKTGLPATATSSSQNAPYAVDDNYATRWVAKGGWLQLDLGAVTAFKRQEIRFEYAWKPYRFAIEISEDGLTWKTLADQTSTGSPVVIEQPARARYLRLTCAESNASIWEWIVCE
jgi:arabinoxylan arabinofuranohydrolase